MGRDSGGEERMGVKGKIWRRWKGSDGKEREWEGKQKVKRKGMARRRV